MSNGFLYVVTVLVWGSTWFAIEFQLGEVAPEVSLVYRYLTAAACLFGWCLWRRKSLRFDAKAHIWFVALGALLFGINYVFAYRAQVYITSALTAIAFSSILWMNIINARLFFGVRTGLRVMSGAALGICGIVVMFAPQVSHLALTDATLLGSSLAVISAFVASLGNMASQRAQRLDLPVVQSNAWGMFYGALISGGLAAWQGYEFTFDTSASYVVSLAYLAVFGSVIAFGAYLTLLGRIGAHRAGYAMVMFPVVALAISVAFEGLEIDITMLAGIALVLAGNLFILSRNASSARTPVALPAAQERNAARASS